MKDTIKGIGEAMAAYLLVLATTGVMLIGIGFATDIIPFPFDFGFSTPEDRCPSLSSLHPSPAWSHVGSRGNCRFGGGIRTHRDPTLRRGK